MFVASPRVTLFKAPAAIVVVPTTVTTPLCVTAPPEVRLRFCPMLDVAKLVANVLTMVASFNAPVAKVRLPEMALATLSMVSEPAPVLVIPAVPLTAPSTSISPAPASVKRLPPLVTVPSTRSVPASD